MKKFIGKQKNCFFSMFGLIVLCEILIRIDNKIIQTMGICLVPIIVLLGYLLIRNDQKKELDQTKER